MVDYEEAKRLLVAAQKDLTALQSMLDATAFADEIFGFHAQQAIEKSLKAWLALVGKKYPRTHDIGLLISLLEESGEEAKAFSDLAEFNPYAVQLRYDAFDDLNEDLERDPIITRVTQLVEQVRQMIATKEPK